MTVLEGKCDLDQGGRSECYRCKVLLDYQVEGRNYQNWVSYTRRTHEDLSPPKEAFYLESHPETAVFSETMKETRWFYSFMILVTGFMGWSLLYIGSMYLNIERTAYLERFKKGSQPVSPIEIRYRYMGDRYNALWIAVFVPWKKLCAAYSWFMPSAKTELLPSEELSLYAEDSRYGPPGMSHFEQPFWIPGKLTNGRSYTVSLLLGPTSKGKKPALAVLVANSTIPLLLDEKLTRLDFTDEERHNLYEAREESVRLFERSSNRSKIMKQFKI